MYVILYAKIHSSEANFKISQHRFIYFHSFLLVNACPASIRLCSRQPGDSSRFIGTFILFVFSKTLQTLFLKMVAIFAIELIFGIKCFAQLFKTSKNNLFFCNILLHGISIFFLFIRQFFCRACPALFAGTLYLLKRLAHNY